MRDPSYGPELVLDFKQKNALRDEQSVTAKGVEWLIVHACMVVALRDPKALAEFRELAQGFVDRLERQLLETGMMDTDDLIFIHGQEGQHGVS